METPITIAPAVRARFKQPRLLGAVLDGYDKMDEQKEGSGEGREGGGGCEGELARRPPPKTLTSVGGRTENPRERERERPVRV